MLKLENYDGLEVGDLVITPDPGYVIKKDIYIDSCTYTIVFPSRRGMFRKLKYFLDKGNYKNLIIQKKNE